MFYCILVFLAVYVKTSSEINLNSGKVPGVLIEKNCDYYGNDLVYTNNVPRLDICVEMCWNNQNCTNFIFKPTKMACLLKHTATRKALLASRTNSYTSVCGYIEACLP
uniref:Apple domain-containing protein n=1 Tax=Romanomermis culicivorax TaxID=13658 RepID=A0A915I7P3_ROMCU